MNQEMVGWQWHQLGDMKIICTSLQTDNHTTTSSLNIFTGCRLFLPFNQQCQSTVHYNIFNTTANNKTGMLN